MELGDAALSQVGRAYGVLPRALAGDCYPEWLIREFRRLRREEFDEHVLAIQAVEVGVARAVGAAFGADVGKLPKREDVRGQGQAEEESEWIRRYKSINRLDS